MKINKLVCDLCGKDCDEVRFGVVSGCVAKMNDAGEMGNAMFEGHYCEEDMSKILDYIASLSKSQ